MDYLQVEVKQYHTKMGSDKDLIMKLQGMYQAKLVEIKEL